MPLALGLMKEHFQRKSGAASPFTNDSQHMWYSSPPRLQIYSKDMINILLNLAKKRLDVTFARLIPSDACSEVAEDLIMATAAVGALYCDVKGSHKVAKSCYNDARRIALAKVIYARRTNNATHRYRVPQADFQQNRSSLEMTFRPCLWRTKTVGVFTDGNQRCSFPHSSSCSRSMVCVAEMGGATNLSKLFMAMSFKYVPSPLVVPRSG